MSKETLIYAGGFVLPDKNAAANRVVSNGKLFGLLGYRTVFLGAAPDGERFDGIRQVTGCADMYEQPHPETSAEWIRHMFSVENIDKLVKKYENVKAVILYNAPFFTLLKAKAYFRKKNVEVYYDCTEWTADTDGSFLKRTVKSADEFLIRNFAHRVADKLIVISSMMKRKYGERRPLLLLPPLVDINDGIWHQNAGNREDVFEFCFAGVPDANKDSLDKVVQAFSRLDADGVRLRIVGVSREEFEKLYPDCGVLPEIGKKISFTGRVSHREAVGYILGCDCYVFLRDADRRNNAGFPTKFAEAYSCGVPIITTDVSDIKKYITDKRKGCVIDSLSAEKVTAAMLEYISKKNDKNCITLDGSFHYESYLRSAKDWSEK